jgi:hypothetical protein
MRYLGEDEVTQMMGLGSIGEVRRGPDGNLYQWVQGVDGLGNPIGFWRGLRKRLRRVVQRALPIVQQVAPFVPGAGTAVAAGLRVAKAAGVAGAGGLGALFQAPDGTVYQVQGVADNEELRGLADEEELRGLAQDEELQGLAEGEELRGIAEEEELRGLAQDEELQGLADEEELQGYVREGGMSGVDAYVPNQPASTRWFTPPTQPPEMWKPLW